MFTIRIILIILTTTLFLATSQKTSGQTPAPPIPVEFFAGNENMYYQLVIKRPFSDTSDFSIFGLATFTADYDNEIIENRLVTIAQVSYNLGKGFGVMAGADMNSKVGFSPVIGPQHNYASRTFLAVTVLSYFLNGDNDLKIFGLYEFKPSLTKKWSVYTRLQFIYNQNLSENLHNRSYLYLRAGLKRNSMIIGVAANLDHFGPEKVYQDNYGPFIRWEF